ncbi:MAG TPA: hypothetical protein VFO29_12125 [Candidatus Rubrimentiphilum sp.]|nr:hypothetical protein [Candidatus Rubrimentiphilum sp.]
MFYYAEYLRGMRALRVMAIILGVFVAIAILIRLWAFSEHSPESVATALQSSPTAHVTTKTLADGTVETIVDDPAAHVHAVIDRHGRGFRMDATMPSSMAPTQHVHISMGSSDVIRNHKTGMTHLVIRNDLDANIPVSILFAIAEGFALITATMLGGALAKENDGHLEIAWTKPVAREKLALASIGVDMATILVSQLATVLLIVLVCAMFIMPTFSTDALTLPAVLLTLLGPLAWYACLTAFSASLKRGLGMVVGLGWLAAIAIPGIEQATAFSTNDVGLAIHGVFKALTYIDPIQYVHISFHASAGGPGMRSMPADPLGMSVVLLLVLTAAYVAAAVLQWRRVEA